MHPPNHYPRRPALPTIKPLVEWILGVDWFPYQRATFITPPFPGYTSGHSGEHAATITQRRPFTRACSVLCACTLRVRL
jgi:hypothetical protein